MPKMPVPEFSECNIDFESMEDQTAKATLNTADLTQATFKHDRPYLMQRAISMALDVSLLDVQQMQDSHQVPNRITFIIERDGNRSYLYKFEADYKIEGKQFSMTYRQIPLEAA